MQIFKMASCLSVVVANLQATNQHIQWRALPDAAHTFNIENVDLKEGFDDGIVKIEIPMPFLRTGKQIQNFLHLMIRDDGEHDCSRIRYAKLSVMSSDDKTVWASVNGDWTVEKLLESHDHLKKQRDSYKENLDKDPSKVKIVDCDKLYIDDTFESAGRYGIQFCLSNGDPIIDDEWVQPIVLQARNPKTGVVQRFFISCYERDEQLNYVRLWLDSPDYVEFRKFWDNYE